ncbi:MAG: hypothetical protein AAF552_16120 [Pseudomonadota bacterium]
MYVQYTPTRSLFGGGTGEIEVLSGSDTLRRRSEGAQYITNDGSSTSTTLFRQERRVSVEAGPVPRSDAALWREFEDSVADGAPFTIDLYGTLALPDNPQTVVLELGSFQERQEGPMYRVYTFTVIEQA